MKKNKKTLLTLSVLGLGLLFTACSNPESPSQSESGSSSEQASSSEVASSSSSSQEPIYVTTIVEVEVEVEKKFGVTVNQAEGTTVTITNPSEEGYSAGSVLTFTVSVDKAHLELDWVKYDGKVVTPDGDGVYAVVVVNQDAAIETAVVARGEENLLDVADVNDEDMPTTAEEFKAVLEAARAKEAKYAKSARLESSYDETRRAEAHMGHNDVVYIRGQKLSYASASLYNYEGYERGVADGRYYEIDDDTQSVTFSRGAKLYSIVSDEVESVNPTQIKESDAKLKAATSGFIDDLLKKTFTSNSYGFLATDSYGWKEITVSAEKAEDGKSYFAKASAWYNLYNRVITFVAEIDGDGFLREARLEAKDYNADDIEEIKDMVDPGDGNPATEQVVGHKPVEGAEPKKAQVFEVSFERGYRSRLDKTDLSGNLTSDYDVLVDYKMPGEYSSYDVVDNTVYNSSRLSFRFRQKEFKPVYIVPTFIGTKVEGFITWNESGEPVVSNVGDFTLQFDNGMGEIKEVPLTSVLPAAKSVSASLSSSKVYNGTTAILTTAINPEGADQSVTVELREDSTCEVTIVDNNDGTFSITGVTNGEGVLVVTSVTNPTLSTQVTFTVEDKPDVEGIKAFLTSNTLHGEMSGWGDHFVNFNEDGTGEYVCYEGGKGNVIPFTWTFDEESIAVSVEVDRTLKSKYYNLGGFSEPTASSIKFEFIYSSSSKYVTLTALDVRLDLETADVSSY